MKKIISMWQNASIAVKYRTCLFFLTWVFSIYALVNNLVHQGFNTETIQTLVATIVTGLASCANWWKNNSFTPEAILGDEVMKNLKSGEGENENE